MLRMLKSSKKHLLSYCKCRFLLKRFSTVEGNKSKFVQEFEAQHIPLSRAQHVLLGIGSSIMSLANPRRADMIAIMGETTGIDAAKYMLEYMRSDPTGSRILRELMIVDRAKPRINSSTVDLKRLSTLPAETLGRKYIDFLEKNNVTPDSRDMVKFVDDVELAYVIQRYREIHDLVHTILDMPTNMLGEVTVKWVEAFQTRLPLCIFGGLFGAVRLAPKQRQKYLKYYLPWAIKTGRNSKPLMNVYFEERWEEPLVLLQKELNISPLVIPE